MAGDRRSLSPGLVLVVEGGGPGGGRRRKGDGGEGRNDDGDGDGARGGSEESHRRRCCCCGRCWKRWPSSFQGLAAEEALLALLGELTTKGDFFRPWGGEGGGRKRVGRGGGGIRRVNTEQGKCRDGRIALRALLRARGNGTYIAH